MWESKEKRLEKELYKSAQRKMIESVSLPSTATFNQVLVGEIAKLEWQLYQKYKVKNRPYYVSKREYNEDLEKINALELRLEEHSRGHSEAEEQLKQAKELLRLIAYNRIRQVDRNRVF